MAGTLLLSFTPSQSEEPAEVKFEGNFIYIKTPVVHDQSVLRIAGPEGYALTLHLTEDAPIIQADLLLDAEPRITQKSDANSGSWLELPVGDYYYEMEFYVNGKKEGHVDGKFWVGVDGRPLEELELYRQPGADDGSPLSEGGGVSGKFWCLH